MYNYDIVRMNLGYSGMQTLFPKSTTVNHSKGWVNTEEQTTTTTTKNTLEGMHGVMKMKARRLNLFSGQRNRIPTKSSLL